VKKIILASESPRRKELLEGLGLVFDIIPSRIEEKSVDNEQPVTHARRLSREKALAVSDKNPDATVIGADTIVIIDGLLLGKPENALHAKEMLGKLSGRAHRVITGFTVARGEAVLINAAVESTVLFKEISEEELDWYTRTPEPYDKAGAYAVQGIGAFFIREIRGSYTNVIGLPLSEVVDFLRRSEVFRFEDLKPRGRPCPQAGHPGRK
jgi:septum formation protein